MFKRLFSITFLCIHCLSAKTYPAKFDGVLGEVSEITNNRHGTVCYFIPYNAVVVEIGAFEGSGTLTLATIASKGHVYSFEPNPRAYGQLVQVCHQSKNITPIQLAVGTSNGIAKLHIARGIYNNDFRLESMSSLLEPHSMAISPFKGPTVDVQTVVLDDWCKDNQIDHIDCLRLDVEGLELQILKSSPIILQTVSALVTKTNFFPFRRLTTQFSELEKFLKENDFEMLSHWYHEGLQGEAIFVKKRLYDSLFR